MKSDFLFKLKLIFIPVKENNWRPRFLDNNFLFYYLLFLFILKLIAFSFLFYFPRTIFFADITKTALFNFTNQERIALGIPSLKENPKLTQAAYLKAKDILEKDYFSHFSPEGLSPWYWLKLVGYDYSIAGENLAIGFLDSREVYNAWLESPSHKANLLNEKYQEVGVFPLKGEFQGKKVTVVVQFFGTTKKIQPIQPSQPIQKEEPLTVSKKEVLPSPSSKEVLSEEKITESKKPILVSQTLSLFDSYYYQILQVIIYTSLIFIIGILIINIFVRFDIQHKDLILKTLGVIGLLVLFLILDRETMLNFIPHEFLIK